MKNLKPEKDEAQEGELVETHWDIKKIVIGLVVAALLFIVGSYIFLPGSGQNEENNGVLGVTENVSSSKEVPPLPDKEDVENVVTNAQQVLSQITSDNLTSSQAAIQKIITDLQSLNGQKDAVGVFCEVMCKDK